MLFLWEEMKAFAENRNIGNPSDQYAIICRAKRRGRRLVFVALAVSEYRHILTPPLYSIAHPTQGPDNTLAPGSNMFFRFCSFPG